MRFTHCERKNLMAIPTMQGICDDFLRDYKQSGHPHAHIKAPHDKCFVVGASKPSLCYLLIGAHSLPTALSKQHIQLNFGYNPPSPSLTIPPPPFTRHQASIPKRDNLSKLLWFHVASRWLIKGKPTENKIVQGQRRRNMFDLPATEPKHHYSLLPP
jgi:hypothetical protein